MTTEKKFTPGPWSWEESCDGDVWLSHQYEHDPDMGYIVVNAHEMPDEANAHLIAAAPELYEALEEYFQAYDENPHLGPRGSKVDKAFVKARAALAKARGES